MQVTKLKEQWRFVFLIPNLSIRKEIGNEYIAITPPTDQRVQALIQTHTNIQHLLNNFTDQFKRSVTPSLLILRNGRINNKYQIEASVDFRNIYAISCVISGQQSFLMRGQFFPSDVGYSDYFNIYPIIPHKFEEYLLTISPAVRGLDTAKDFLGQTSPEIITQVYDPDYDAVIFKALMKEWESRHIQRNYSSWETTALFRSLQIAYQACSMPVSNFSTIYDYGTSLALWVSAFEILAHPKTRSVEFISVLSLFDNSTFKSNTMKHKLYTVNHRNRKIRVNLPQKLYSQIYDARNTYLHGNPVRINTLFPWGKSKRRLLNDFAPVLFKIALISRLEILLEDSTSDLPSDILYNQLIIENTLLKSKTNIPKEKDR